MSEGLRGFAPQIWIADGSPVSFFGFAYSTRMAVIQLSNGGLFVWSPIALSAALKGEVDALGAVQSLVSPNKLHHLFLGEWKSAYPHGPDARPSGSAAAAQGSRVRRRSRRLRPIRPGRRISTRSCCAAAGR